MFALFLRKKFTGTWITEVEMDLQEMRITSIDHQKHDLLKKKLGTLRETLMPNIEIGMMWTKERK